MAVSAVIPSQTLLQLLQGPTRLAVGALSGAAAADLLLGSSALCYVERPIYDDDVFKSMYGSSAVGKVQAAIANPKPTRLVGRAALVRLVTPAHISITLARNVGLTVLIAFNRWLIAALEEEEAAEAQGREPEVPVLRVEELGVACKRGAYNACVELSVQATRCWLDHKAVAALPPKLAQKLIKDLKQSAAHKARLPWYTRTVRVAKTAAYSEATWWMADLLVSCALEVSHAVRAARSKLAASWQQLALRLALRCTLHAVRAGLVLAAVAAGNGVGSAAPRGRGLVMWASAMASSFVVNGYMMGLMNRVAPLAPAGGAAGGASGAAAAASTRLTAGAAPPTAPAPGHGFVMVGQQVHPAAEAAAAAAAAALVAAPRAAGGAEQAGAAGLDGPLGQEMGGGGAAGAAAARAVEEAPAQVQDAGVQAGVAGAAEPPIPAPQQRRVVGGPRLPDRPARRNAAAGPEAGEEAGAAGAAVAAPLAPMGPPPAAPHTPQFRDQRAPTPAGDSEEAEARAAAAAAAGASPAAAATPGGASPAGSSGPVDASPSAAPAGQQQQAQAAAAEQPAAGDDDEAPEL